MNTHEAEEWHHTVRPNERKLRYIGVGTRNAFFPRMGTSFEVKIGRQVVEMVIDAYGRMKPRFIIWSTVKLLDEMEVGDRLAFVKRPDGVYEMKKIGR